MSGLSNYSEEALAKHLFGISAMSAPGATYLRLHTADPGEDGTTSQLSGGSYAPVAVTWAWDNGSKAAENSGALEITGMPAATLAGFSVHSASSGGNCLAKGTFSDSSLVGQVLEVAAGSLAVALAGDLSNWSREYLAAETYFVIESRSI